MKHYKKAGPAVINTNRNDYLKARSRRANARKKGSMIKRVEMLEETVATLQKALTELMEQKV